MPARIINGSAVQVMYRDSNKWIELKPFSEADFIINDTHVWILMNVKVRLDGGRFELLPAGTKIISYGGVPRPGRITALRVQLPSYQCSQCPCDLHSPPVDIGRMDILS